MCTGAMKTARLDTPPFDHDDGQGEYRGRARAGGAYGLPCGSATRVTLIILWVTSGDCAVERGCPARLRRCGHFASGSWGLGANRLTCGVTIPRSCRCGVSGRRRRRSSFSSRIRSRRLSHSWQSARSLRLPCLQHAPKRARRRRRHDTRRCQTNLSARDRLTLVFTSLATIPRRGYPGMTSVGADVATTHADRRARSPERRRRGRAAFARGTQPSGRNGPVRHGPCHRFSEAREVRT